MRLHGASDCTRADRVQLAAQAAGHCPCQPQSDASSPDTPQARLSLRSASPCNQHPPNHQRRRRCGCTVSATEREQIACSSLLRRPETVHADPKAMQARLIRGRLASACVPPACATAQHASINHHRRRGCGCTVPATVRGQIAYSSLLRRPETAHADPGAMPACLIRNTLIA